jgi:predicted DNA-binding ribbon-helix-helix protein
MSKEELKKVYAEVTNDVWKKLKILSVQKELSLPQLVKDILDRTVSKKNLLEQEDGA